MTERVQKVLAAAGHGSRREIERWIQAQRLCINGRVAQLGDTVVGSELFTLDGRRLLLRPMRESHRHIIYNKPGDEITSQSDPENSKRAMCGHLSTGVQPRLRNQEHVPCGRNPVMNVNRPSVVRKVSPIVHEYRGLHDNQGNDHP